MRKTMGTYVVNGVTFIFDGVTKKGVSVPIRVCPKCGEHKRVNRSAFYSVKDGKASGLCHPCAVKTPEFVEKHRLQRYKDEDEHCENGAVVHWSQRAHEQGTACKYDRVPVTYNCGHLATIRAENAYSVRQNAGYCLACSRQDRIKYGPDHYGWNGGRFLRPDGYIRLTVSGLSPEDQALAGPMKVAAGHVLEHRLVMARKLGRPLERHEFVHHLNGIGDDNRIENLLLMPDQAAHSKANKTMTEHLRAEIGRLQALLDEAGIPY